MQAKIYYWKDIKHLLALSFLLPEEDPTPHFPTRIQFEDDYALICETEIPVDGNDFDSSAEFLFSEFNSSPLEYATKETYKAVGHTSMSIGDIVDFGESIKIVLPVGFKELKLA